MTGVPGLLLTGGRSSRMGTDKARLVVGGETLAARAARVLGRVCNPVLEVGPGVSGLRSVRDDPPDAGPLAALATGAAVLGDERPIVVLAVDLPFVDVPLLELLATWPGAATVVPVVGGEPQTCCARYAPPALARAAGLVAGGSSSLRALLDATSVEELDESIWGTVATARAFADLDTPDDVARLGLVVGDAAAPEA